MHKRHSLGTYKVPVIGVLLGLYGIPGEESSLAQSLFEDGTGRIKAQSI